MVPVDSIPDAGALALGPGRVQTRPGYREDVRPKGAILIERGAAVCRLGVLGARLVSYLSDEGHDGLLRHFVPGRK